MFEFFIAKKYLGTKHKLNFITIISILSTLGITIGVAALIIVISVFNGFGSLAKSMLLNFDPHIRIIASAQSEFEIDKVNSQLQRISEIKSYYPYLDGKIILQNKNSYQFLDLKGIEKPNSEEDWGISQNLYTGELNLESVSGIPQIALSLKTSLKLRCKVGDTITSASLKNVEKLISNFLAIPSTKRFVVSGIYQSNSKSVGPEVAYASITSAQQLFGTRSISGFEIRLSEIEDSYLVQDKLENDVSLSGYRVETWYDMHKDFYDIMQIERWSAFILLMLIISVATFNILGSLTMSVIEKRRDIGILRSMGAKKNSILRIFMFEGLLIGTIGTILGYILGLLVCYLQMEFKLYPLDPMKYIIDAIPIKLEISDLIIIPIVSMLLSFFASLYPSKRAVKLNVIDSIKYE